MFIKNNSNIIYKTSEGQIVFQEKIFTPFEASFVKTEHLGINNSIKNINSSSN
jgi:hypothetical protein